MKIERFAVQACCGTTTIAMKLSTPISKDFLPSLVSAGFIEAKHFTKAGLLYIENEALIISGTFGANIIHVRCKTGECTNLINDFEQLLTNME